MKTMKISGTLMKENLFQVGKRTQNKENITDTVKRQNASCGFSLHSL